MQASTARGAGASPPAPEATYQAFFGTHTGQFIPVRLKLRRALVAANVSRVATGTLEVLWEYALLSIYHKNVEPNGWVRVWPSRERLAREMDTSEATIHRHLKALEEVGALVRVGQDRPRQGSGTLLLRPPWELEADLLARPAVQAQLAVLYPDEHDAKVTPIASHFWEGHPRKNESLEKREVTETRSRAHDSAAAWASDAAPDDDWGEAAWVERTRAATYATLWGTPEPKEEALSTPLKKSLFAAVAAEAAEQGAAVKARRESTPAAQRMGGGQKKAPAPARTDTAPAMLRMLKELVVQQYPNAYTPVEDLKALGQMKQLLARFGEQDVYRLIEFVGDPANFDRVRAKWPKIEIRQPTPGFLLAWGESLMDWLKQGAPAPKAKPGDFTVPKRSGGAEVVERPATDSKGRPTF